MRYAIPKAISECDPDNLKAVSIEEFIAVAAIGDKKLSMLFSKQLLFYKTTIYLINLY